MLGANGDCFVLCHQYHCHILLPDSILKMALPIEFKFNGFGSKEVPYFKVTLIISPDESWGYIGFRSIFLLLFFFQTWYTC